MIVYEQFFRPIKNYNLPTSFEFNNTEIQAKEMCGFPSRFGLILGLINFTLATNQWIG